MSSEADVIQIKKDRFLKQNPYAHVDGDGNLSALPPIPASVFVEASSEDIKEDRKLLENPYAHDHGAQGFSAIKKLNRLVLIQLENLNSKPQQYYSDKEIEGFAKTIQVGLWKNRKALWGRTLPSNPIELLNPEVALKAMGFDFELAETLGQVQHSGKPFEVAGTINKKSKRVQISRQFTSEVRRFTSAHELGHAIMHASNGLHRDRPIDGSSLQNRSSIEFQADKFAAYFLMPEKLIRKVFKELFLADQFILNEETAFALGYNYEALSAISLRELAKLLAKTERFNFRSFDSLATQFYVSEEAMAIRLEELNLIIT